jgi:hypothetical protein
MMKTAAMNMFRIVSETRGLDYVTAARGGDEDMLRERA